MCAGQEPLELGGIPELQEAVSVLGFPAGGDNLSVTQVPAGAAPRSLAPAAQATRQAGDYASRKQGS